MVLLLLSKYETVFNKHYVSFILNCSPRKQWFRHKVILKPVLPRKKDIYDSLWVAEGRMAAFLSDSQEILWVFMDTVPSLRNQIFLALFRFPIVILHSSSWYQSFLFLPTLYPITSSGAAFTVFFQCICTSHSLLYFHLLVARLAYWSGLRSWFETHFSLYIHLGFLCHNIDFFGLVWVLLLLGFTFNFPSIRKWSES